MVDTTKTCAAPVATSPALLPPEAGADREARRALMRLDHLLRCEPGFVRAQARARERLERVIRDRLKGEGGL